MKVTKYLGILLSVGFSFAQVGMASTPATPENLISDVAMASLIKGHDVIQRLTQRANEACRRNKAIPSRHVLKEVDEAQAQMKIAATLMHDSFERAGFWKLKNQACSPGDEAFVNAFILGLGNGGLSDLRILIPAWKNAGYALDYPACWVAKTLKETTYYAEKSMTAATRYQRGDMTPICD